MAVKLTKRKGFNFFRSYFDVYNELEKDSDKVAFIDALLDRQFLGIKPEGLKGLARFAYISQTNSIDGQVKGYNDKMKRLDKPLIGEVCTPTVGGQQTPCLQEKGKGKEEEEQDGVFNWGVLLDEYNTLTGKKSRLIPEIAKKKFNARIKDGYTKQDIWTAMVNCANDSYHKETNYKYFTLEFISRPDKLDMYLSLKK